MKTPTAATTRSHPAAWLAGAALLALMVGPQQGTPTDWYAGLREAWAPPRLALFGVLGLSAWGLSVAWLRWRDQLPLLPVRVAAAGVATLVAAGFVVRWTHAPQTGAGRLIEVAPLARHTPELSAVSRLLCGWPGALVLVSSLGLLLVAVLRPRWRPAATTALGLMAGASLWVQIDISRYLGERWGLGGIVAALGWILLALALHVGTTSPRAVAAPPRRALPWLALVVAAAAPALASSYWQTVLVTQVAVYVLLAMGLAVVVGWAGLLDLGFIAFFAIGCYVTAFVTGRLPIAPPGWLELSPLQAIPLAIAACVVAGVALGAPTVRLRGDYLAVVTLGFGEIVRVFANNLTALTSGPAGAYGIPEASVAWGPLRYEWGSSTLGYWYLFLAFIVLAYVVLGRLHRSRIGRSWAAVRQDELAAEASGVRARRAKLLAFAVGASTSGVAGVLVASQVGSFTPENFVLANSILVLAYVVFGGLGSLPGAMAGATVLIWLPEFLKAYVPAPDRQLWVGAALLALMIVRPGGLFPPREQAVTSAGTPAPPR